MKHMCGGGVLRVNVVVVVVVKTRVCGPGARAQKPCPPASSASWSGLPHTVLTPAEVSSLKYVNGGLFIFLSSGAPTVHSVT